MANRPWYYVKGNPQASERLIAQKREKEAERDARNQKIDDYFSKWRFQNEILEHWNEVKKTEKPQYTDLRPAPFDLDFDPNKNSVKNKELNIKVEVANESIETALSAYKEIAENFEKLEIRGHNLLKEIANIQEIKKNFTARKANWKLREERLAYVHFSEDKLQNKSFLICEQLNYCRVCIEFLSSNDIRELLSEEEFDELELVIKKSLKIIQTFTEANYKRTSQFMRLFSEEAKELYNLQEEQWQKEEEIWSKLLDQILEAYFTIYKNALSNNLSKQEDHVRRKHAQLNELNRVKSEITKDTQIHKLLSEKISL